MSSMLVAELLLHMLRAPSLLSLRNSIKSVKIYCVVIFIQTKMFYTTLHARTNNKYWFNPILKFSLEYFVGGN